MIRKNKFADNVAWIVGGQILHAVLSFLINIIAARVFGDAKYGIINYVSSELPNPPFLVAVLLSLSIV